MFVARFYPLECSDLLTPCEFTSPNAAIAGKTYSMRQHNFIAHSFTRRFPIDQLGRLFGTQRTVTGPATAVFHSRGNDPGGVFVYSFGALTFWNCDPQFIKDTVSKVENLEDDNAQAFVLEDFNVEEVPGSTPALKFNSLVINELTPERAEVVAMTLAQSVTMEVYEQQVDRIWATVGKMLENLRRIGRVAPRLTHFHRLIADVVGTRSSVVGVLHLLDKPDLIWNDPAMDSIYSELRASFDLEERFRALQYKLENVQDSIEIIIDMARDSRLFILEASIVALILIEIVLTIIKW